MAYPSEVAKRKTERAVKLENEIIRTFSEEVNKLDCTLMDQSGKLEGMHRAAMVRICKELGIELSEGFG